MRIAILGGTGGLGGGLALRWGLDTDHDLLIGAEDPERARTAATEFETELSSRGVDRSIGGFAHGMAAERARVVVLAVPAYDVADRVETIADRLDETVLVTPATSTRRDDDGVHYRAPGAGSVTQLVAEVAPAAVPVVGAFHGLPAGRLADLDAELGLDTLLVGDDPDATDLVGRLIEEINGLRALAAGGLAVAAEAESLGAMLANVRANEDRLRDPGVRLR
jgi:hypothetical protein